MKKIRTSLATIYALAMLLMSSATSAGPTVVELFTSQGCSSCPPADALVHDLSSRDDLLVLTLPVTYWDYLGWADSLGRKAHDVRQNEYANRRGANEVYTPQIIIDGAAHTVGSHRYKVERLIAAARVARSQLNGPTTTWTYPDDLGALSDNGTTLSISAASNDTGGEADIILVRFDRQHSIKIGRGENRGHTVTYTNVVRDMTVIGTYQGAVVTQQISIDDQRLNGTQGFAVLLQDKQSGHIIGAAQLKM